MPTKKAGTEIAIRKNLDASVADIAAEAGMGRQTLYGHFQTRAELIEAALVESLDGAEDVLSEVALDGDARVAFQQLVASSWVFVDQSRALLATAQKELSAARIRELHEKSAPEASTQMMPRGSSLRSCWLPSPMPPSHRSRNEPANSWHHRSGRGGRRCRKVPANRCTELGI